LLLYLEVFELSSINLFVLEFVIKFSKLISKLRTVYKYNSINKAQIKSTNLDRLSPVQVRISEYAGKGTVDGNGEKSGPASNFGLAIRKAPRLRLLG
jgi:hypothetical protein